MKAGTTFLADDNLEIGFDYEEIGYVKYPTKINYIEKKGKNLDLSEYEVEDLADLLQSFFNMDDCRELAESYFMNAEIY